MQDHIHNFHQTASVRTTQPLRQRVPSDPSKHMDKARSLSNPRSHKTRENSPDDLQNHNASGYGFEVNNKPLRNKSN